MSKRLRKSSMVGPSLGDIAKAAGVSTATVSRVINHPDAVRPELRARVQSQIDTLGYVADGAARALASRRSKTIGAVIPTLASAIFADGIDAFEHALGDAGYSLILATSGYDAAHEARHIRNLVERGVDGLLLVGRIHDEGVLQMLARRAVPFIETWTYDRDSPNPCVGFDNQNAAFRMAAHILDLGHRDVAMIAGVTAGNDRATERVAGVRAALAGGGVDLPADSLIERPYEIAAGRQALRQLMNAPSPPTAVICGNDVLAVGALLECLAAGLDVPGQVSIAGFDDLALAAHLNPPLTTMHVPSADMGRRAATYLVERLAGNEPPKAMELDVALIVRGTTGPRPGL